MTFSLYSFVQIYCAKELGNEKITCKFCVFLEVREGDNKRWLAEFFLNVISLNMMRSEGDVVKFTKLLSSYVLFSCTWWRDHVVVVLVKCDGVHMKKTEKTNHETILLEHWNDSMWWRLKWFHYIGTILCVLHVLLKTISRLLRMISHCLEQFHQQSHIERNHYAWMERFLHHTIIQIYYF